MSETLLLWLFGILGAGEVALFLWVYAHSIRDAKRESRLDELSQEVGHVTIHGSIMERLHRYGGWLRDIRRRLGLGDE